MRQFISLVLLVLIAYLAFDWYRKRTGPRSSAPAVTTCTRCGGTGLFVREETCPTCNGTGHGNWALHPKGRFSKNDKGPICMACKGAGKTSASSTCLTCQGRRVIASTREKLAEKGSLWDRMANYFSANTGR